MLQRNWFLVGLTMVFLAGFSAPEALQSLTRMTGLRDSIVAGVMFMTTLPLEMRQITHTLRRPVAPLLAILINYGLLPLVAIALSQHLEGEWALGLIVAAAAPCTVASAAVWTRRAGGNDIVAVMVTVVTNLLCFVLAPMWLAIGAGRHEVTIELGPMISKLAILVMLPMLAAQLIRQVSTVVRWTGRNGQLLATLSQLGILSIVLVGSVHCGLRLKHTELSGIVLSVAKMVAAVVLLHVSMLWVGQSLGRAVGLPRADWIAVGFAGSQKTLTIGLQIALMIGGGLVILPMVAYHVSQLVIDTLVADRLRDQGPYDDS